MKNIVFTIFLFSGLLFFLIILSSVISNNVSGRILEVDDDKDVDYNRIQNAINAALNGDTVFVYNGTYNENIVINKSINLIGESPEKTIINGQAKYSAINISINSVNITGFTITNAGSGISIFNYSNNNITKNIISNNFRGVYLRQSNNNNFEDNIIIKNFEGFVIISSHNNYIKSNNVSENTAMGFEITYLSNNNSIINNTISNKQTGLFISDSNDNNIIRNFIISNAHDGVWIYQSEGNNILYNNIFFNKFGISLDVLSNENEIKYNNISYNEYGIYIELFTINNTITDNVLLYNNYGIYSYDLGEYDYGRTNNTIDNNILVNNEIDVFRYDLVPDYSGYAFSFGSLILVSTFIFTAGTEIGKYKFLIFFLPLYSRLNRDNVLDQFTRGKINGYIIANPGTHYNIIKRKLKLKNGTLAYHLNVLERENIIKSKRDGIYKRFFPYELTSLEIKRIENNEHKLKRKHKKILEIISEKPGITQKNIIQQTNYAQPTVNYNIRFLLENDLIYSQKEGRETKYFLKSIE